MPQPLLILVSYRLLISRKELKSEGDKQGKVFDFPLLLGARDPLRIGGGGFPGKWGVLFCPTQPSSVQQPPLRSQSSLPMSSHHSTLISLFNSAVTSSYSRCIQVHWHCRTSRTHTKAGSKHNVMTPGNKRLTRLHSQKDSKLHFGESFTLSVLTHPTLSMFTWQQ